MKIRKGIEGTGVEYTPAFFTGPEADALLKTLLKLDWHQHIYRLWGKNVPAPRHYVWMGESYVSTKAVGDVFCVPFTAEALAIKARVEAATGTTFNSCNVNLYKDQGQYIGWHQDGEAEGSWDYLIASVSLGSARDFQVRRGKRGEIYTVILDHGSLVTMPAQLQHDWKHRVRKTTKPCGPRINLTFRRTVE